MVTRRFAPWRLYTSAECASLVGKLLFLARLLEVHRPRMSVGRQTDVRLQRHYNVRVRLILKVFLMSKTDVNLSC